MDGVISNFTDGAIKLHNLEKYKNKIYKDTHCFINLLNGGRKEFEKPMTTKWWANLEPMSCFDKLINLLQPYIDKEKVCILSCPMDNRSAAGKIIWLEKYLKDIPYCLVKTKCKKYSARKDALLIDDYEPYYNQFIQNGGNAILFPATDNKLSHYSKNPVDYLSVKLKEYNIV